MFLTVKGCYKPMQIYPFVFFWMSPVPHLILHLIKIHSAVFVLYFKHSVHRMHGNWIHTCLQVLLLSHNQLTNIPTELFKSMSGLRIVDFSHNKLHSLPDMLFTESGLEQLMLSHNFLKHPPVSSLGPTAMASLCELDLSWNLISEINSPDIFAWFKVFNGLMKIHRRADTAVTCSNSNVTEASLDTLHCIIFWRLMLSLSLDK